MLGDSLNLGIDTDYMEHSYGKQLWNRCRHRLRQRIRARWSDVVNASGLHVLNHKFATGGLWRTRGRFSIRRSHKMLEGIWRRLHDFGVRRVR